MNRTKRTLSRVAGMALVLTGAASFAAGQASANDRAVVVSCTDQSAGTWEVSVTFSGIEVLADRPVQVTLGSDSTTLTEPGPDGTVTHAPELRRRPELGLDRRGPWSGRTTRTWASCTWIARATARRPLHRGPALDRGAPGDRGRPDARAMPSPRSRRPPRRSRSSRSRSRRSRRRSPRPSRRPDGRRCRCWPWVPVRWSAGSGWSAWPAGAPRRPDAPTHDQVAGLPRVGSGAADPTRWR